MPLRRVAPAVMSVKPVALPRGSHRPAMESAPVPVGLRVVTVLAVSMRGPVICVPADRSIAPVVVIFARSVGPVPENVRSLAPRSNVVPAARVTVLPVPASMTRFEGHWLAEPISVIEVAEPGISVMVIACVSESKALARCMVLGELLSARMNLGKARSLYHCHPAVDVRAISVAPGVSVIVSPATGSITSWLVVAPQCTVDFGGVAEAEPAVASSRTAVSRRTRRTGRMVRAFRHRRGAARHATAPSATLPP